MKLLMKKMSIVTLGVVIMTSMMFISSADNSYASDEETENAHYTKLVDDEELATAAHAVSVTPSTGKKPSSDVKNKSNDKGICIDDYIPTLENPFPDGIYICYHATSKK